MACYKTAQTVQGLAFELMMPTSYKKRVEAVMCCGDLLVCFHMFLAHQMWLYAEKRSALRVMLRGLEKDVQQAILTKGCRCEA